MRSSWLSWRTAAPIAFPKSLQERQRKFSSNSFHDDCWKQFVHKFMTKSKKKEIKHNKKLCCPVRKNFRFFSLFSNFSFYRLILLSSLFFRFIDPLTYCSVSSTFSTSDLFFSVSFRTVKTNGVIKVYESQCNGIGCL